MDQRWRPDGVLRTGTTAVGLFSSHHKARYWGPAVPGPAISAEGQCKLMNFTVRLGMEKRRNLGAHRNSTCSVLKQI